MPKALVGLCAAALAMGSIRSGGGGPAVAAEAGTPPGTAPRITLEEAVGRALARNPTMAVAAAEIDRAQALVREARAAYYPTVAVNAAYTRLDSDRVVGGRVTADTNQLAGNVTAVLPLIAPVAHADTAHARENLRVAELGAADARRLVAQATARTYLSVVAQHRLVAVAETARESAKAHYEYAHTRFTGGVGRSIDEVRAAQDLAADDAQVQAAYAALARVREALGVLLGASEPVDSVDVVDLGPVPTLAVALEDARSRRTDVRAQEGRVSAAQKLADDVWVYYAPYLAAVGQPFAQTGTPTLPTTGWQAQLVLTLPLYDGGARGGIGAERRASLAEARAVLDSALRQAQSDVRVAFEAMVRADQALVAAREAARLAKRAYDLANLGYQGGATDNLQVIDAASRQRDADVAAAQAEDVSRQARLDLLVGSGRFP
jgi:outer membrane protein TolC